MWCADNNLALNTMKTKELIVDFRKKAGTHIPIHINGMEVERVASFKFLSWTLNTSSLVKETEEGPSVSSDSREFLQLYHREHPYKLHLSMVWQLLCRRP